MKALFDAIYGELAGSSLATNYIGTRMYPTVAPQGTAFPYVTFQLVPSETDWTLCLDMNFDMPSIQFDLYSETTDDAEVNGMFTDLKALYDWCDLTVAGYTFHYMRRELFFMTKDLEAGEQGIWRYMVQYEVLLES